ncbi:MAG: hypothetical protein VX864_01615 [Pseudomonadota bacterium]|nr:hypothetical protein [Pseudomonadota bacterium]MEC8996254.1 hypothetical protein [Pseudomonadota bacterium]MED5274761.1 hypothetical protein [Pseudomonadota bacterium]MED5430074.1 hypothetical protein [Pseudomonadota bacterium]|tara:strand:- start:13282 stop:13719 length:438 start_codon:yes stop_codon:yes gene_type:complete
MIESIKKEEINIKSSVDFLVPFTNVVVNLLSSVDLVKNDLEIKLGELQINKISDDEGRLEFSSIILDFEIYILYVRARSFVFKIDGLSHYTGFSFMETNKGIRTMDNLGENPMPAARELKEQFLKNYKRPYLVTKTFLEFYNKNS